MPRPRADSPKYSLTKRGPRWYIQWWQDGRARRVSTGTEDERQARRVLAAHVAGAATPAPPDQPTIAAILDGYLDDRRLHVASYDTLRHAATAVKSHLGDLTPQHLTTERGRSYAKARVRQGRSNGTVIREVVTLRAALRWAVKAGWIASAPHVEAPKAPRPRDRWLTREEAARLLDATRAPHMRLFIALALYTAARAGAVLDMQWSQIDLGARRINLGAGTGNKRRAVVPIADPLMDELLIAAELRTASGSVVEYAAAPVGSIKTAFKATVRRAGLKHVTPHTLRHTSATWMAQAGVPMGMIAGFLGNSEAVVQRVYAHHHPDFLRQAADALAGNPRQLAEFTQADKPAK